MGHQSRSFRHGAGSAGFTLLEVMVVVILLGVLSGALLPNLGGSLQHVRLEGAAEQLANAIDYSYQAASTEGRTHVLMLPSDGRQLRLLREPTEEEGGYRPFGFGPDDLQPVGLPGTLGNVFPEDIVVAQAAAFDEEFSTNAEGEFRMLFFPDGTTEFASIYLTNRDGDVRVVNVNGMTGAIRIETPVAETDEEDGSTTEDEEGA